MRLPTSLFASAIALLLAACGGGDTGTPGTPTQPNNQPGPPASLSVVSGDAQSAAPKTLLSQPLSVLVKDAAGTALSGITVQFTVDSGGGSLSSASATTGSNGVAVGGTWTLGSAIGMQVASARVGSLAPLRFHAVALGPEAQPLFAKRTIPANGGTITFEKSGDPLNGLSITVPAASFPGVTEWTVTADSTRHAQLPPDMSQVGPMLIFSNNQGYADSAITFTMPLSVPATDAIAPFYYDSATATYEGIPLVSRSATSATFATRHFSRDLMAIPGNVSETSALRTSMRLGFGEVKIVWVAVPRARLVGTFSSSFRPAVDNWEFVNRGEYVSPGGICEGMSITEIYYHLFHAQRGEAPLYHHFDKSLEDQLDNVQGIRFAGSVQGDYLDRFDQGVQQIRTMTDQGVANGTNVEDLTSTWILLTLKLTGHPILMALQNDTAGHAVVAYAATSTGAHTEVSFSDPNYPTAERTMAFESGALTPVPLSTRADRPSNLYRKAYALSLTTEVPLTQIQSRYAEFVNDNAGADRYPSRYDVEYYDIVNDAWTVLAGTISTSDDFLTVRHICSTCPVKTINAAADQQRLELWDGRGRDVVSGGATGRILNATGSTTYYARLAALSPRDPAEFGFVDAIPFEVIYQPFSLSVPSGNYYTGDDVTFTAEAGALDTPKSKYRWTPDDGGAPVVAGKTFTYRLAKPGVTRMDVTLLDETGKAIARTNRGVVAHVRVALTMSDSRIGPGKTVQLIANITSPLPAGLASQLRYEWYASGSPAVDCGKSSIPTTVCTFPVAGKYAVTAFVYLGADSLLGFSPEVPLEVRVFPGAWRLTSFTLQSAVPLTPVFPDNLRPTYNTIVSALQKVETKPGDGLIFLDNTPGLPNEHGVYFEVMPTAVADTAIYSVQSPLLYTMLARESTIINSHYTSTGTLTSGSIDGAAGVLTSGNFPMLNRIVAAKNGKQMTGTLVFGPTGNGGVRTYTFAAVLVTP